VFLAQFGNNSQTFVKGVHLTLDTFYVLQQRWPNFLTRGLNSQLPDHWRAGYSAIYVIYVKTGCYNVLYYNNNNEVTLFCLHFLVLLAATVSVACSYCKCCCDRQVNKRQASANAIALLSTVGNMVLEKTCTVFGEPD